MFGEACPFVRGVGCHGHSRKNSRLGEILTFLTLGEKRVGLCFTSILASDHIIKKCFALLSLLELSFSGFSCIKLTAMYTVGKLGTLLTAK